MSDAELTLVTEWRELLARHAVMFGALECELQQRHGIGVSEFEALEQIATCAQGKCRAARLSDAVHLSQSAASRLIARLERAGLVERAMCEHDRRGIVVTLTEEGRRRYAEARPTHRAVLADALHGKAAEAAVTAARGRCPDAEHAEHAETAESDSGAPALNR